MSDYPQETIDTLRGMVTAQRAKIAELVEEGVKLRHRVADLAEIVDTDTVLIDKLEAELAELRGAL
jgi:hypothetical protein